MHAEVGVYHGERSLQAEDLAGMKSTADAGRTHLSVLEHEKSVDLSGDSSRNCGIESNKYGLQL